MGVLPIVWCEDVHQHVVSFLLRSVQIASAEAVAPDNVSKAVVDDCVNSLAVSADSTQYTDGGSESPWLTETSNASQPSHQALLHALKKPVSVQPWDERNWKRIKILQNAPRNRGCVELMHSLAEGRFVAVKRMPTAWVTGSAEEFETTYPRATEKPWMDVAMVRLLHRTDFPYVCEPIGIFTDAVDTFIVSEFADGGDLFSWCQNEQSHPGPGREVLIRPLLQQIVTGIGYLHQCGIAHRDISLENIVLVNPKPREILFSPRGCAPAIKLIDFGMVSLKRWQGYEMTGKPAYQAPEMHEEDGILNDAFLIDAFAVGVTSYCLAANEYPWTATRPGEDSSFTYARGRGISNFLAARRLHSCDGVSANRVFTPAFSSFLGRLIEPESSHRYCLADGCFDEGGQHVLPSVARDQWLSVEGLP